MNRNKLINLLLFQAIWFTAAFGQQQTLWLLGLLLGLLVLFAGQRITELKVMTMCGGLGIAMDTVLTLSGVLVFTSSPEYLPLPLWFLAIWFGFAATFRHSLNALLQKPLLMTLLAAVAAPLNYLAGARIGALEFGLPTPTAALVISVSWLIVTPVLIKAYRLAVKEVDSVLPVTPSWFDDIEQGRKSS